jgi:uncharacterized repeat protein (TIGR01451 family)
MTESKLPRLPAPPPTTASGKPPHWLSLATMLVGFIFLGAPAAHAAPGIALVQACPASPIPMGSLYTFSGYVTNTGDATLMNVFVFGPQDVASPLLGPIDLLPGGSAAYTCAYTVPFHTCSVVVTTSGNCGGPVISNLTSCPVATSPGIAITKACPPAPVAPGGTLVFTGTLLNTGNVTLTNVIVVNSQPAPNTPVIGPLTLTPGAYVTFTGAYVVPVNACSSSDTLTVTARDTCGTSLTSSATANCPFITTPALTLTELCPPAPVAAGATVDFSGLVSNSGNITLTNVLVFSRDQGANTPVLGPLTLTPGASAVFAGSYVALSGAAPATNTTIITNASDTITTNSADLITTNTAVTILTNAPAPTDFGTINAAQEVVDRFVIGTNFNGLTYAGEDHGYAATLFYALRKSDGGATFFDTVNTSTGTNTDRFDATTRNFDALTYAAPDLGYGPLLFYYLSHDTAGVSTFGSITPGGAVGVTADHFVVGNDFDALTFSATDVGFGANLFYYVRHDATGLSTFGTINPALPGTITDRFTVGMNVRALVFTALTTPGYGANNFYYLRQDANGVATFGTIQVTGLTSGLVTDRFVVGANIEELTFTATDVGFGPNLFYYLRSHAASFTTNSVTSYVTNSVTSYTTNTTATYTTNSLVTFSATNTVSAVGMDICQGRTVVAAANCAGAVDPTTVFLLLVPPVPPLVPVINGPTTLSTGAFNLSFPTEIGKWYTVQFKHALSDPAWTDLEIVVGTGASLPIIDTAASLHPARFYRVIATQ